MSKENAWRHRFGCSPVCATLAVAMMSCLPAWPAAAQSTSAASTPIDFTIPAGDLAGALDRFSLQTGVQTSYQLNLLAGKQAKALSGRMTWQDALSRLLQGSGLEYRQISANMVVIRPAEMTGKGSGKGSEPTAASTSTSASNDKRPVTEIEGMTVTGTRIRGGDTPSPVLTIGAENIREEGFTDLGEVIRSVPQNFTGGQNPGVFMGGNLTGGGLANQNVTGGSSLNLRGLGPDASLTLLNGHRMAYGGFSQAVDISAIPVDAVERIEIVADGASAIYGSDAVGGVANVILKRDFNGVSLGTRYGTTADGGLTTREYTATAGTSWSSGGLIATFKNASIDPIYARQRDYSAQLAEPSTIYPGSDLHSGLVSINQSFGDSVELSVDALRTKREQTYNYYYGTFSSYYAMTPRTTTTFVSPSVKFSLPSDWMLTIGGAWGKDESIDDESLVDAGTRVREPFLNACLCNKSRTYELNAEGPLFRLDGGDARLAVGAGYRRNELTESDLMAGAIMAQGDESSRFAYAELNLPLIGGDRTPRLDATAALRTEDYDNFGRITTPKIGLIYNPNDDFTLKGSWGRSFKMPTLDQQHFAVTGLLRNPARYGGTGYAPDETMLLFTGGNPDLKPERARTWTASLAFHPESLPGLETELTWFDINYTDRVVQPIPNYAESLSNPNYREFVEYSPTAEQQAKLLALAEAFYNTTGQPYDPSKVVALVDGRYVNATSQQINGLDLAGSYRFDLQASQMTIRGSASWLESTQQTRGTPSPYDLAGTLNNPARFHVRIGAVWSQRELSLSLFANYASGVTNPADGKKSASFTTFDSTVRYATNDDRRWWSGLEFALSISNLFDRAPPLYALAAAAYVAPYDSTNYSAIGRFVNLSASKHW